MSSEKRVRIGLLGAARITPPALIVPAEANSTATVVAIAARDVKKAKEFAAAHKIPRVHSSYQTLIDDPEIDLIYNALPASLHRPWTLKALEAGKHVLCEKPIALNAQQAREMIHVAESKGCLMIEAFHYRYHPLIQHVLALLQSDAIGQIREIEGVFNVSIENTSDIRYQKGLGGGALMDLGCYPVHWLRTCVGEEPIVTSASAVVTASDVDISLQGEFSFPGGAKGRLECSMLAGPKMTNTLSIQGSTGSIKVINPLVPHFGYRLTVRSDAHNDGAEQDVKVKGQSTYQHQLDAVIDLLQGKGRQITGGEDCVNNMIAIDSLYRAAGVSPFSQ
ncbi:MAG: putative dehydrogenase [Candidatus Azotimanducaceae bacterium]|jgi:predicted dehydrogenase